MKFYSSKNSENRVSLKEAVLHSLPIDGGLYLPEKIPSLEKSFFDQLPHSTFQEIAIRICSTIFEQSLSISEVEEIVRQALNFPVPLVTLDKKFHVLELFHGPSLAFKDFGARFMAQLMKVLDRDSNDPLTILVATSGDTGGAVASGFYDVEGINVIILYPSGKVSPLQEKQLTSWVKNIHALEIQGSFDDCQTLVKRAFLDEKVNHLYRLSSANSINIARLIPQSLYYFEAFKQLILHDSAIESVVFSIPSGNFGNLTAGLIAKKMGLPIKHLLAATNANDVVPRYLQSATFNPTATIPTIANAMDVGNPSNFQRLFELCGGNHNPSSTWNNMKEIVIGSSFKDEEIRMEISRIYSEYQYLVDPHTAVASLAWSTYQSLNSSSGQHGIILETAHPSKFIEILDPIIPAEVPIPLRLSKLSYLEKKSTILSSAYEDFKNWLINHYTG